MKSLTILFLSLLRHAPQSPAGPPPSFPFGMASSVIPACSPSRRVSVDRILKPCFRYEKEPLSFTGVLLERTVLMTTQAKGTVAPGRVCRKPTRSRNAISIKKHFDFMLGTLSGMRKGKNPSLGLSLSIFSKAHSTADLISSRSNGFIAW